MGVNKTSSGRRKNSEVKCLAIIRVDRHGDFLLWLPTAKFYRSEFPNASVTMFVSETIIDLVRMFPYWDEVVSVDKLTAGYRGEFDLLINPQFSRTAKLDKAALKISARNKIALNVRGPNMSEQEFQTGNSYYSELLDIAVAPLNHEVATNFAVLNAVTGKRFLPGVEQIHRFVPPAKTELPSRYAVIFPGSSWTKKNYPWPRMVELCQFMHDEFKLKSLICGTAADDAISKNICANAPTETINLVGKLSLAEVFSVTGGASLVISNESMGGHAANVMGVRSLCFVSGGYLGRKNGAGEVHGRFYPYPETLISKRQQIVLDRDMACRGCSLHCKYADRVRDTLPCIEYIPVALAKKSIAKLLERSV